MKNAQKFLVTRSDGKPNVFPKTKTEAVRRARNISHVTGAEVSILVSEDSGITWNVMYRLSS